MTETWESAGPEFYDTIIETVENHPDWQYTSWVDRDVAPEKSAAAPESSNRVEYTFQNTETGASLNLGVPDLTGETPYAAQGFLSQGVTLAEDDSQDQLITALKEAQGAVSRNTVGDQDSYVEPVEDLHWVASVQVPFDYDPAVLESSVDALSSVSESVDEKHSDVFQVLETYRGP
jgi:hypothetical protein